MTILWLDTETYSEVPIKWGTYRYVENCECMIVTYAIDDGPVQVWDRTDPLSTPDNSLDTLMYPEVQIRIHNVPFDRGVLRHALGIDLPIERFYDTSIQARAHALPGRLGPLCEALGLGEDKAKIKDGKSLIQLFCKPRPKNSKLRRATRETHPEEWARFIEYAKQDVVAMRAASKKMPTWNYSAKSPEMALWYLDQKINDRGIYVDLDLANAAIRAVSREKERLSGEMQELTGYDEDTGAGVRSATERDTFLAYIFEAFGILLPDLQKATLAKCLDDDDIPAPVKELIENRLDASSTAARKYNAVINAASPDGRVRGTLQFDGAGRTRRWCLTGDHEVFTLTGWQRLDLWRGGRIACWSPSGVYSFQDAEAVSFPFSGGMLYLNTQRHEQISTPDHVMPVWADGEQSILTVEKIRERRNEVRIRGKRIVAANGDKDALRVIIMTQADGHYTPDGVRFHFKKARKISRCRALLRRAGIMYMEFLNSDGSTSINISRQHLPKYLTLFHDKEFGPWILDECPETFFAELELWDGSRQSANSIQYTTGSKNNADLVQAFAHLSGLTASILSRENRDKNWNINYAVNIWLAPTETTGVKPKQFSTKDFTGTVYCASTPTGFFLVRRNGLAWITGNSGRTIQPQNMFKSKLKDKELDAGIELLKFDVADLMYDDVTTLCASAVRGVIIAPPGRKLVVSDLSNIEGRDTAWLTEEKWKLQAFRDFDAGTGPDLYKLAYAKSFRVRVESVTAEQRQGGKTQELALQFGGGVGAFVTFAKSFGTDLDALADKVYEGLPEDALKEALGFYDWSVKKTRNIYGLKKETFVMCEVFKRLWREANPNISASWKEIEDAVKSAIHTPGETIPVRRLRVRRDGNWLRIALPSGRSLCYPQPQVDAGGQISYMGQNQYTRKWQRLKSFGGKFLENAAQSFARDLMADNLPEMEDAGYYTVLTAHDEAVTETLDSSEFTHIGLSSILATNPSYAKDLPLEAKGFEAYRYRKG